MKKEFRTEKCNTKVENLTNRPNSRMEVTAERIHELGRQNLEIAQSNQQRKNRLERKFKRSTGFWGL